MACGRFVAVLTYTKFNPHTAPHRDARMSTRDEHDDLDSAIDHMDDVCERSKPYEGSIEFTPQSVHLQPLTPFEVANIAKAFVANPEDFDLSDIAIEGMTTTELVVQSARLGRSTGSVRRGDSLVPISLIMLCNVPREGRPRK